MGKNAFDVTYRVLIGDDVEWVCASQPMAEDELALLAGCADDARKASTEHTARDMLRRLIYLFHLRQDRVDLRTCGRPWKEDIRI